MMIDKLRELPLPTRPGTLWKPVQYGGGSYLRCGNCGGDYNKHGAPAGEPEKYGLPKDTPSHLMCKASDEAWERYWRDVRLLNVTSTIELLISDLRRFNDDDRAKVLEAVNKEYESCLKSSIPA